jgi:hypothetical protein
MSRDGDLGDPEYYNYTRMRVLMPIYTVKIPITGYSYVTVDADCREAAIDAALEVIDRDQIDEWETPHRLNHGSVRYCLSKQERVEVEEEGEERDGAFPGE